MNNIILPPLTGLLIKSRFHGPTDYKAPRVSASMRRDSETIWRVYCNWQHALNPLENHITAANKLINKYWPEDPPVIFSVAGNEEDFYAFTACGPWQFGCGAQWLLQQREAWEATVSEDLARLPSCHT